MSKQTDKLESDLLKLVGKAAVGLTLEIDSNLRRSARAGGTPVDTGHARANWVPSVGTPHAGEVGGNSTAAHEAGVAAVVGYNAASGQPLFVSNNAPYIGNLNLGSSPQADPGFIEAAIDKAVATMQKKFASMNIELGGDMSAGSFADAAGGVAASNLASAYSPFGD